MTDTSKPSLHLRSATTADLSVLPDIWFNAFHPVSPFTQKAFPDTLLIREYWEKANTYALNDPDVRLMVVVNKSDTSERVIAIARFGAPPADTSASQVLDCGTWSRIPWTADHDAKSLNTATAFQTLGRQKAMTGKRHYFVELLATTHECKGKGAGKMLIDWVCKQADKENVSIFVDTNKDVVKFCERFGFVVQERMVMPGEIAYEQYLLIRPPRNTHKG